ncbi:MAG: FeoC-like transcriptional regulator [Anaerolineaceae bacterium]|jgi:hypothetical protein|nr:FeoC-like transcriptional regulator [Anaerolineaceae bacterium]
MLKQLLRELEKADSGVNLNELAKKLGVERSALEGMIACLVQTGKLRDDDEKAETEETVICSTGGCTGCPGVEGCPFVMNMPRSYSLRVPEKKEEDE